jgi:hypothetical protein
MVSCIPLGKKTRACFFSFDGVLTIKAVLEMEVYYEKTIAWCSSIVEFKILSTFALSIFIIDY